MKRIIRDYFTFNKRERNGAIVLLFIITLLLGYLALSPYLITAPQTDFSAYEKEIAALADTNTISAPDANQNKTITAKANNTTTLFDFNPNALPDEKWKQLGLSDKQIKTIKNFEAKGGKFYSKADVKKMYCISDKLYQQLENHIVIPPRETTAKPAHYTAATISSIELNTADSAGLLQLKGIGPAFAKRIISYRTLLGGFYDNKQLLEVYGIDSAKYEAITNSNNITVQADKINQLHINTASLDVLKKHPYIKFRLASLIINYRLVHGNYKSVEDLKKLELMSEELYIKLKNYININ